MRIQQSNVKKTHFDVNTYINDTFEKVKDRYAFQHSCTVYIFKRYIVVLKIPESLNTFQCNHTAFDLDIILLPFLKMLDFLDFGFGNYEQK